jgi:hypothetical protein
MGNFESSLASRSVRSACDRGSQATFSMVSHRMGDQNLLSPAPLCFGRHVRPLVPVAFAVVSSSFKEAAGCKNNCRILRTIAEVKQHRSVIGWVTKIFLSLHLPCLGRHVKLLVPADLQSLVPTNPQWARVVGYDPFSLSVIHTEGQCPSSGNINRLLMMMNFKRKSPLHLVI